MINVDDLISLAYTSPKALKDLEKYVDFLVDEYFDRWSFRRTKLFKEIERIYQACPQSLSITQAYTGIYVLLEGIDKGKRGAEACAFMRIVQQQFSHDEEIAENYSSILTSCSNKYEESSKCQAALDIVKKLHMDFPDSIPIIEDLYDIQNNLENVLEYEKWSAYTEKLRKQITESPDYVQNYIDALSKYSKYVDLEECNSIKSTVKKYIGDQPNKGLLLKYAEILLNILRQSEEKDAIKIISEIQELYENHESIEFAIIYSEALCELAGWQNSNCLKIIAKLKEIHEMYSANDRIAVSYAEGLFSYIEDQKKSAAKKALIDLFNLAKKHPDNEDIQDFLYDAKNAFESEYEDAVFWEKEQLSSHNCFAILDAETNWNNMIMSIGVVICDVETFIPQVFRYFIIEPEYKFEGLYSRTLDLHEQAITERCTRKVAISHIDDLFRSYCVKCILSYNTEFNHGMLPELDYYMWYDIMPIAANRNYNCMISKHADCYENGLLKRRYGIEPIIRCLYNTKDYHQTHNALFNAVDELKIIQRLGYSLNSYNPDSLPQSFIPVRGENEDLSLLSIGDRVFHKKLWS